jgi:hypothetical protein
MTTPKQPLYFDHQVFDLSFIENAIRDIHERLATPVGGFAVNSSARFR